MRSIHDVRSAAGALPQSRETFPFDAATLVFKVGAAGGGGRMYALTDISADPPTLSLKVRPERSGELRAEYAAISPGHHLNKRHWITVTLDGTVPDSLVQELLVGSHALVVRGLTRTEREELGL